MTTTWYLGVSSADAVMIPPDKGYKFGRRQLRAELRTKAGGLFLYRWGDYAKHKIPVDFLPAAAASTVNSWWETNTPLLFFVESGGVCEVHSVMIMNDETPMEKFSAPYVDRYSGTIELEGY